jgi:hypothetical protein
MIVLQDILMNQEYVPNVWSLAKNVLKQKIIVIHALNNTIYRTLRLYHKKFKKKLKSFKQK